MLTINDLTRLYQEGIGIKFRRKNAPDPRKGDYCPSARKITVFEENIESKFDQEITLLHEMIHARDDFFESEKMYDRPDQEVDQEALDTYEQKPEVLEFLKQLYSLK